MKVKAVKDNEINGLTFNKFFLGSAEETIEFRNGKRVKVFRMAEVEIPIQPAGKGKT